MKKLLSKIDGFLLKIYPYFMFTYFLAAFISFMAIVYVGYQAEYFIRIYSYSSGNLQKVGLDDNFIMWIWVFSPLIVGIVWKRIFHPND
tara:strand:+ start:1151 stop:1417 length:267 start_codon:yes stop_codon:yes gene_type:complete